EFGEGNGFQTRVLLCLDRKQWSRYGVQRCPEGTEPVPLAMSKGNQMDESRIMIECGGVWVELFEQSTTPERRVTKASIAVLETKFAEFLKNPAAAVEQEQERSRQLVLRLGEETTDPFFLTE